MAVVGVAATVVVMPLGLRRCIGIAMGLERGLRRRTGLGRLAVRRLVERRDARRTRSELVAVPQVGRDRTVADRDRVERMLLRAGAVTDQHLVLILSGARAVAARKCR